MLKRTAKCIASINLLGSSCLKLEVLWGPQSTILSISVETHCKFLPLFGASFSSSSSCSNQACVFSSASPVTCTGSGEQLVGRSSAPLSAILTVLEPHCVCCVSSGELWVRSWCMVWLRLKLLACFSEACLKDCEFSGGWMKRWQQSTVSPRRSRLL